MSLSLSSGHVLALAGLPEDDFAPFVSVVPRGPDGAWSIDMDGLRLDAA